MASALILGNGDYASFLLNELKGKGIIDFAIKLGQFPAGTGIPIDLTVEPANGPDFVETLLDFLKYESIDRVVFGGDFRFIVDDMRIYSNVVPLFVKNTSFQSIIINSVPDLLNSVQMKLSESGIIIKSPIFFNPNLAAGRGLITRNNIGLHSITELGSEALGFLKTLAKNANPRVEATHAFGIRHSLIYDNHNLVLQNTESTDICLEQAAKKRKNTGSIRTLLKLCPRNIDIDTVIDSPIIGLKTIELANKALIDAIVVDADRSIIHRRKECIEYAESLNMTIYGWTGMD